MKLTIIKSSKKKEFKVIWVELETPVGNFIIAKGHAPMVVTLSPNKQIIFQLETGKEVSENISGGIANISRHEVQLLLEN